MPFVTVSTGLRLHFEVTGAGPPLLLMDGVGGSWVWFKNLPALSRYFSVVILDVRGTGLSDKPLGPYSIPVLARETADVIAQLGLGVTSIIGLSQGGQIALEVALEHPGLVSRIITVGTTPGGPLQVPPSPQTLLMGTPLPFLSPHQNFLRRISNALSPYYMATHPIEMAQIEQFVEAAPTPEYVRFSYAAAEAAWLGVAGRSQLLRAPTLVVNGEIDRICPLPNAFVLANLIPFAALHVCSGSGHLCEVEQTEAFDRLALDFLLTPR